MEGMGLGGGAEALALPESLSCPCAAGSLEQKAWLLEGPRRGRARLRRVLCEPAGHGEPMRSFIRQAPSTESGAPSHARHILGTGRGCA